MYLAKVTSSSLAISFTLLFASLSTQAMAGNAVQPTCLDAKREIECFIPSAQAGKAYHIVLGADDLYASFTAVGSPFKGDEISTAYEGSYKVKDQWHLSHIRLEFTGPFTDTAGSYIVTTTTLDGQVSSQRWSISKAAANELTPHLELTADTAQSSENTLKLRAATRRGSESYSFYSSVETGAYYYGDAQGSAFPPYYHQYYQLDQVKQDGQNVTASGYNLEVNYGTTSDGHTVKQFDEHLVSVVLKPTSESKAQLSLSVDGVIRNQLAVTLWK